MAGAGPGLVLLVRVWGCGWECFSKFLVGPGGASPGDERNPKPQERASGPLVSSPWTGHRELVGSTRSITEEDDEQGNNEEAAMPKLAQG